MTSQAKNTAPLLKVDLLLPTSEGMLEGRTPRWDDIVAIAQRAEALGFDALWVGDHLVVPADQFVPGAEPLGAWECWSLLAALAAATTRIGLGSLVTCTAFRNPALLAKMADTVDEVSGGRLILGLGAGSVPAEFAAFGYPADHRLAAMRGVSFSERPLLLGHFRVTPLGRLATMRTILPSGRRPSGPPLLLGARNLRMDRLAGRYADIWKRGMAESSWCPDPTHCRDRRHLRGGRARPCQSGADRQQHPAAPGAGWIQSKTHLWS